MSRIWGTIKQVQNAAANVVMKGLNDLDTALADDKNHIDFSTATSTETVYEKLLNDAQFQIVQLSRESQVLYSEKEKKIWELQARLIELGETVDDSSTAATEDVTLTSTEGETASSEDNGNLDDEEEETTNESILENQLKQTIVTKNRTTVELIQLKELFQQVTAENKELKVKYATSVEIVEKLAEKETVLDDRMKMDERTMEDLVMQYSNLMADKTEKEAKDSEFIGRLTRDNMELKQKVKELEKQLLSVLSSTPGDDGDGDEEILFDAGSSNNASDGALREEMDNARGDLESLKASHTERCNDFIEQINTLNAQLESVELARSTLEIQLAENEKAADDIALLKHDNIVDIEKLTLKLETKYLEEFSNITKERDEALKLAALEKRETIDAILKEKDGAIQKITEELTNKLSGDTHSVMEALNKTADDRVAQVKEEAGQRIAAEMKSAKEALERAVEEARLRCAGDTKAQLSELRLSLAAEKEKELRSLVLIKDNERDETLKALELKCSEEKNDAVAATKAESVSSAKDEILKMNKNHAVALNDLQAELTEAFNSMVNEKDLGMSTQSQKHAEQVKIMRSMTDKMVEKNNETMKKLQDDVADKLSLKDVIIEKTKSDADEKIAKIQAESDTVANAAAETAREEMSKLVEEAKGLYQVELVKRKKIHNKLIEIQGNIRVFCRVRPMLKVEADSGKSENVTEFPSEGDIIIRKDESSMSKFEFDHVFNMSSEQDQVFNEVSPIITSVIDGYNACIFAYGQTGSGKTYTMEGPVDNRGVNFRAITELFKVREQRSGEFEYKLELSMLEIYNEKVRDLTVDSKAFLDVKLSKAGGTYVDGLNWTDVECPDDVIKVMGKASSNRSVGSHNMNEHSSRSHLAMCIIVRSTNKHTGQRARGKLYLIDLAGSERVGKTDATGTRLEEAKNINRSLSALGDVVAALGSGSKHIPFRNSKLTYLLQDSLSGDSKVLMFVNVSPVSYNVSETLCSLKFAERCRKVALGQAKQHGESEELVRLRKTVEMLKSKMSDQSDKESISSSMSRRVGSSSTSSKTVSRRLPGSASSSARSSLSGSSIKSPPKK